jgi:hypothetical protein
MSTRVEKIIFTTLGAVTAVIFGLAMLRDADPPSDRQPASKPEPVRVDTFYFYYFD